MKTSNLVMLAGALSQAKSRGRLEDFLEALLSPREINEFACRLKIVKMLRDGVTRRQICEDLKVGRGTITRGSRELKAGKFQGF